LINRVIETNQHDPVESIAGTEYETAGVDRRLSCLWRPTPYDVHDQGGLRFGHPVERQLIGVRRPGLPARWRRIGVEAGGIGQIGAPSNGELQLQIGTSGNETCTSARHLEAVVAQDFDGELGRPLIPVSAEGEAVRPGIVVVGLGYPMRLSATTHQSADQLVLEVDARSDLHDSECS
jgi:hypothetical protein